MDVRLGRIGSGVTVKILFIGLAALALLIPTGMIEGPITERSVRSDAARLEIGNLWGRSQTVGAPMLALPFRYTEAAGGESRRGGDVLMVLPETLTIMGSVTPDTRRRGIYEVPVYTAALDIGGTLPPPDLAGLADSYQDVEILWSDAELVLPLADARPIVDPVRIRLADAEAEFEAGGGFRCVGEPVSSAAYAAPATHLGPRGAAGIGALALPVPPPVRLCDSSGDRLVVPFEAFGLEPPRAAQSFSLRLTIRGTGALRFLPLGDVTDVRLTSPWPSPSFTGSFVPIEHEFTDQGFTAIWRVLALGRGYPSAWLRSHGYERTLGASSFGVDLIPPLGVHAASLRAVKYAILFIGFTFLVYFLFEVFAGLRLHVLQYLAVGIANSLFFLLLLALAEHVGFALAYLASAAASTLLIAAYSAAILEKRGRAWPVAGMLAAVCSRIASRRGSRTSPSIAQLPGCDRY